jgi:hypothetical protein
MQHLPPQPDFILNACDGTASAQEFDGTALRAIDPGAKLALALNRFAGKVVVSDFSMIKNITLLETTKHGELLTRTASDGRTTFRYNPITDYVGKDRAVFMADYNGKHYKIVVNLQVSNALDNELCPDNPYQLEKVTKPSSGASIYGNDFALGMISVTFSDLPGSAVGQTVGSTITLDTNAARSNGVRSCITTFPVTDDHNYR